MPQQQDDISSKITLLISRAQADDADAINQLLILLQPLIRQRIQNRSIAVSDCDDLLQDIFLRICRSIDRYKLSARIPFDHFLNRLIKTSKYDYYRKQTRLDKQRQCLIEEAVSRYHVSVSERSIEEKLIMEEKCKDIMTYCKKLSKLEQEVVQYTLDDYSPKEIANKIGINEKAVYNALHRCKKKLLRQFEHYR
uniref:Sigma factor n=1 Tax=Staphylococcus carnosus TaxID=1281 RepID=A9YUT1_STACA|nr:sigma factor [Staphylococcus carnosus]